MPQDVLSLPHEDGLSEKTQKVAKAQRLLLISILVNLLGNALLRLEALPWLVLLPVALATLAFSLGCVHRLSKALGIAPLPWLLAMVVPLVNLIGLVILNQKATVFLKGQGLKVGLMGAEV